MRLLCLGVGLCNNLIDVETSFRDLIEGFTIDCEGLHSLVVVSSFGVLAEAPEDDVIDVIDPSMIGLCGITHR